MSEVMRNEFDGLGTRLNSAERVLSANEEKTKRNGEDIQKLFALQETTTKTVHDIALAVKDTKWVILRWGGAIVGGIVALDRLADLFL